MIEIDDDHDYVYVPPVTPFIKQEESIVATPSAPPPSFSSTTIPSRPRTPRVSHIPPPSRSTRASARIRRPPGHLDDYHLFTTVAEEQRQPSEHPYHTAGGTDVDLATLCLAEEMAKLDAHRAARREIEDAVLDLTGLADEGLTWRLSQAAEARHRADHPARDDANDMGEDRAALSSHLQALIDDRVWEKKR